MVSTRCSAFAEFRFGYTFDSTGAVYRQYFYDPYGNLIKMLDGNGQTVKDKNNVAITTNIQDDPGFNHAYTYAGYRYDAETGLYFLNARYYAAGIGRFLTKDSWHGVPDDPQSLNRYAYAGGDPVNLVDPSGHYWVLIARGAVVAVKVGVRVVKSGKYARQVTKGAGAIGIQYTSKNIVSIGDKALKEVREKWGQRGVDAFSKAANKGIVNSKGESGITALKGGGIKIGGKNYTHEIKVKNKEFGDYMIFGYKKYQAEENDEAEETLRKIDINKICVNLSKIALTINYGFDDAVQYVVAFLTLQHNGHEIGVYESVFTLDGEDVDDFLSLL